MILAGDPPTILLTDEYKRHITARAVPGAWKDGSSWFFQPHTDHAALVAMKLFPHVAKELPPEQLARVKSVGSLGRFDAATPWAGDRTREQLLPNVPPGIRDVLYPYQVVDLAFLAARMESDGGAYMGWDRGLGKTLGAITISRQLECRRILVVTPSPSKQLVWAPEFRKWCGDDIGIRDVGHTAQQRKRAVREWLDEGGVLLAHYEALRLLPVTSMYADLIVVDEAHRLKGGGPTKAPEFFKALRKIRSKYRLALSGSVIVNSPEDFFGANHWLFPEVFRSRWRDWNDKYLQYADTGFGRVLLGIRPAHLQEMQDALKAFMVVRAKEDELEGLPAKVEQTISVALTTGQRKVYDQLAEQFLAELPDGTTITTSNHLANLIALRKVASGITTGESAKIDLAIDLCRDNLPHKTVVFAWHRDTVDLLVKRLCDVGVRAAGVHGGVSDKHRRELIDGFRGDDVDVLVATIKTLGESVDLTAAADLIFVESSWTAADMEQATDRVYRNGQSRHVSVTHIVAKDTVDDLTMLPAVTTKADMRRMILGG